MISTGASLIIVSFLIQQASGNPIQKTAESPSGDEKTMLAKKRDQLLLAPPKTMIKGISASVNFYGPIYLLRMKVVRDELRFTPEQSTKLTELDQDRAAQIAALDSSRAQFVRNHPNVNTEVRYDNQSNTINTNFNAKVSSLLTAKQKKRLSQIIFQSNGSYRILTDSSIHQKLNLDQDQIATAHDIYESSLVSIKKCDQRRRDIFKKSTNASQAVNGDASLHSKDQGIWTGFGISKEDWLETQSLSEQIHLIEENAASSFIKQLDKNQKFVFNSLHGEPFDFVLLVNDAAASKETKADSAVPVKQPSDKQ